jgi:hypothetical protein
MQLPQPVLTCRVGGSEWDVARLVPLEEQPELVCEICGDPGAVVWWETGIAECADCLRHDENFPVFQWCSACAHTPSVGCLEHCCPDCGKRTHAAPESHAC